MENRDNGRCALCGRELAEPYDEHHIVPKSRGGREKVELHRICHSKIHSVFNNRELQRYYNTIERLRKHPDIKKFVNWLAAKPPGFYKKNR
jgi:5-methylcytosine-specific restriction endonuclease McrA